MLFLRHIRIILKPTPTTTNQLQILRCTINTYLKLCLLNALKSVYFLRISFSNWLSHHLSDLLVTEILCSKCLNFTHILKVVLFIVHCQFEETFEFVSSFLCDPFFAIISLNISISDNFHKQSKAKHEWSSGFTFTSSHRPRDLSPANASTFARYVFIAHYFLYIFIRGTR